MDPTRYIISCAPRTGSTMLVHLLRSHPRILSHGEVFTDGERIGPLAGSYPKLRSGNPSLDARLWRRRIDDPRGFLYDVVFDAQEKDVVGLKFKTGQAFRTPWADIQAIIAADEAIRVIRLRRDPLGQFISHEVVMRRGGVPINLREGDERPIIEPFRAKPSKVLTYVEEWIQRDALADAAYSAHPQLALWYDGLAEERTHQRLCDFLGVERRLLTTRSVKVISDPARVLLNFDEIAGVLERAGLRETPTSTPSR